MLTHTHPHTRTRTRPPRRRRTRTNPAAAAARAVRASWRGALAVGAAVAILALAGGVALFLRTDRGRFTAAEHVTRDDARALQSIRAAIDAALTEVNVADADRTPDPRPTGVRYALTAQLPSRTWPVDANIALTQHLRRIGATVWDAIETTRDGRAALQLTCGTHRDPLVSVVVLAPATPAPDSLAQRRGGALALILTDVDWDTIAYAERFARATHGAAAAIVPGERKSSELAERLARAGAELLVYLPMEPKGYPGTDPGPDPILVDMKPDRVRDRTHDAVRRIRGAAGIANRMGSFAMQDLTIMRTVMTVAANEHLYFVELPASQDAVTRRVGREVGVPVLPCETHLDARKLDDPDARITAQLDALLARAAKTGRAIATVHADSATCENVMRALRATHTRLTPPSASL